MILNIVLWYRLNITDNIIMLLFPEIFRPMEFIRKCCSLIINNLRNMHKQ